MAINTNRRPGTIGKAYGAEAPKIDRSKLPDVFGNDFLKSIVGKGVLDARITLGDKDYKGVVFVNESKDGKTIYFGNSNMGDEGGEKLSLVLFTRGQTEEELNG